MADEKYPRQGDHMTNDETELRPSHSTCMECGAVVGTNSNCENCRRMATRNWPSRHLWGTDGTCLNCGKMEDRANEQCIPVANGDKGLAEIKTKCEQYWNEHRIGSVEVHAILEFIHTRTVDVIAKGERLEQGAKVASDGLLALTELFNAERADVKRLEAALDAARSDNGAALDLIERHGHAEGMEAAVVLIKARHDRLDVGSNCEIEAQGWLLQSLIGEVLAAAKQQTGEAGSRGDVKLLPTGSPKPPPAESPGSASPVPEMVRKLYDLAYHASRNAHQAWEHETSFEVCTTEVCINARETLDVFTEVNANNADFRDGGDGEEQT